MPRSLALCDLQRQGWAAEWRSGHALATRRIRRHFDWAAGALFAVCPLAMEHQSDEWRDYQTCGNPHAEGFGSTVPSFK